MTNSIMRDYEHCKAMYDQAVDEYAKTPNNHTLELLHKREDALRIALHNLNKEILVE